MMFLIDFYQMGNNHKADNLSQKQPSYSKEETSLIAEIFFQGIRKENACSNLKLSALK